MKTVIADQSCGFLIDKGRFVRFLSPGTYRFPFWKPYVVKKAAMKGRFADQGIPMEILLKDKEFAERILYVQIPDGSIGFHSVNGNFSQVLPAGEYYFWNVYEKNEVRIVDVTKPEIEGELPIYLIEQVPAAMYRKITVGEGEAGLLYFDGKYERTLPCGIWYYWNYGTKVSCVLVDLKIQRLEISGQEILTADKVGVRLNILCQYRVSEPAELVKKTKNIAEQIYSAGQLAAREYVGKLTLDELLNQKEEIGRKLEEKMKEIQSQYPVEIGAVGIKDIILPGEIRAIMNTVLVAEKQAQANVITRREEVASTRSLLNTARLMEENQILYRLKEMEYLERICEKVGSISLSGTAGILEQLAALTEGSSAIKQCTKT